MTNVDNALRILEENNVSGFYQLFVLIQTCMHTYQAFTNMNKLYFFLLVRYDLLISVMMILLMETPN